MKNKNYIKNIVGWGFFVLTIFWLIRFGNFGETSKVEDELSSAEQSESSTRPTSSTPIITVKAPNPKPAELKPWIFDRQTINLKNNTRMDWSVPTTSLTQPTEWFNVENVSYWGYRVKSDCLVEYRFKDPTKTPVVAKMEYKTSNHYNEGTTDLWTTERLLDVVDNTAEMRFLPLPGQSLVGPTVYRSE